METIQWIIWILLTLVILYQFKNGISGFLSLWNASGLTFAVYVAILFLLAVARVLIRDYSNDYIGLANWILILYIAVPILFRLFIRRGSSD
jgi:hypothetical protein